MRHTRVIKHRNRTAPNPNKTIYIHSNRKPRSTTVINMFPQPMRGVTVVLMCDHSKNNMHYMHAIPNYSQFICNDNDSNNEFHLERWVFFGCAFIFSKIKNAKKLLRKRNWQLKSQLRYVILKIPPTFKFEWISVFVSIWILHFFGFTYHVK